MEIRSWNDELLTANLLFKRVFNNILIERTFENGTTKLIPVKCQYGQRSRIFKNWQNAEKRAQMTLPMIVISRNGYSRDPSRLNNLHNEVKFEVTSKKRIYDLLTPVPININYEMTVLAKYPSDIDQIASNFMTFFNSSIYVSCEHPKYEGVKMNNQIVMDDSVSEEHPDEFDGSADDLITTTFNFTFKTFLFAGTTQSKRQKRQIISSYISSIISSHVVVIAPDQIDDFQKQYPHNEVSSTITCQIDAEITSYVDDPNISDDVYDFLPIIKKIDIGYYPTPMMSTHIDYMNAVDTNYKDIAYDIMGYISSSGYISSYRTYIDEDTGNEVSVLSNLEPVDMHYDFIDTIETIAPYKDRLIIKINGASINPFPDNAAQYRKFQDI